MSSSASVVRKDIQGLRAVAVLAVVLFHLRPDWFPGGFVGVDIFFVISGFLITGSILDESGSTGRVRLLDFWSRRIRRLMPAATVVLVVVAVASTLLLSRSRWPSIALQVAASAGSFQNWVLVSEAVSYLHATSSPSPLQHFWSLSVEEQFYLVWPVLVVLVTILAARTGSAVRMLRIVAPVMVVALFAYSCVTSFTSPELAYFSSLSRAWELLLGASLALWRRAAPASMGRALTFAAGLCAVLASIWLIGPADTFPGYVALLPTFGAAAMLWAGQAPLAPVLRLTVEWRPVGYLGDISYSLYLWHWPVIIFAGAILGVVRLPLLACAAVAALSVLLAGLSKRFIEDRFRRARNRDPAVRVRARRGLLAGVAMAAASALTAGSLYGGFVLLSEQQRADQLNFPGARILDPDFDLASFPDTKTSPEPDLIELANVERQLTTACLSVFSDAAVTSCEGGDPAGSRAILLVGDSHAAQWFPAVQDIAQQYHWRLVLAAKQSCSLAIGPNKAYPECSEWNSNVRTFIKTQDPLLVITSSAVYDSGLGPLADPAAIARQYSFIASLGVPVVAIRETPVFTGFNAPECLSRPGATPGHCSEEMNAARVAQDSRIDKAVVLEPRASEVDLTPYICASSCESVVGNLITYRDDNHLTDPFADSLTWALRAELREAFPLLFDGTDGQ